MNYTAVIVAAGSGSRMNLGYNKVYYPIDGIPILQHAMSLFVEDEDCIQIVVVTDNEDYHKYIKENATGKIVIAQGGETRQESVANGVHAAICEKIMIHDGARPFLDKETLQRVKEALEIEDAVCVMVPCKDTIKRCQDGYIVETLVRQELMAAQTPQAFTTALYRECMEKAEEEGYQATDDCALVERYSNIRIKIVEGSYKNKKITTIEDLQ